MNSIHNWSIRLQFDLVSIWIGNVSKWQPRRELALFYQGTGGGDDLADCVFEIRFVLQLKTEMKYAAACVSSSVCSFNCWLMPHSRPNGSTSFP